MRAVGSVVVMSAAPGYFDPDALAPEYFDALLADPAGLETDFPPSTLPDGFRLWRTGDDRRPAPKLAPAAYHGPVGEYMAHARDHSEADPAGVGFTVLTYLGVWLERSVIYDAGRSIRHHPSLWGALVGDSSSGGKGVAGDVAGLLLNEIDPLLVGKHSISGIGSGPALIDRLSPAQEGQPARRVVVHEHELANVLKVCEREGSTLSGDLRKAYDLKELGSHTRQYGDRSVEGYFLGAIGSITPTELRSLMTTVSIENGFANRWLLLHCRINRPMPGGDTIDDGTVSRIAATIHDRIGQSIGRIYSITGTTRERWESFYVERREGIAGEGPIVRSYSSRHVAHAARLAITFAAIDGATELEPAHIEAAIAWCDYSLDTVRYVFGDRPTSPDAAKLLAATREAGADGLTGTQQRNLFSRNRTRGQIDVCRAELEAARLVHTFKEQTAGRPLQRTVAIHPDRPRNDQTTNTTKGCAGPDLRSFRSLGRGATDLAGSERR